MTHTKCRKDICFNPTHFSQCPARQDNYIVLFSGGMGSWAAAKRIRESHPNDIVTCLFTDTLIEDEDLYRFLPQAAGNVGGQLVTLTEGRDVWEVFFDNKMIGNTRADICFRVLKREPARNWIDDKFPDGATVVVGIDWTEIHRFDRMRTRILCKESPRCTHGQVCSVHESGRCEHCDRYDAIENITSEHDHPWFPHTILAPLCDDPLMDKADVFTWAEEEGLEAPRLYEMDFPHNNCGGFCVKQGHAAFANLLIKMPERYAHHEAKEEEFRTTFGKDVAILRDRRGGTTKPFTLAQLRERLASEEDGLTEAESLDLGGCGCMVDD